MKKRRRTPRPSGPLLRQLPTQQNILRCLNREYPGAQDAFDHLTGKGVEAEGLRKLLLGVAASLALALDHPRTADDSLGVPPYTLRRFPKRLTDLAHTIERINASRLLDPQLWLLSRPRDFWDQIVAPPDRQEGIRKRMAAEFRKLPGTLRWYAHYLEAQTGFLGRFGQRGGWNYEKWLTIRFLDFVRQATGKPCFEDVATLLSAAFLLAGQNKTVTPGALKVLWVRNPRFHHPSISVARNK